MFDKSIKIMTCWDNLPMELRQMIFKFKRLNHFKQRIQSLSVLLQNQKAIQHDGIVNMFINKKRGFYTSFTTQNLLSLNPIFYLVKICVIKDQIFRDYYKI